MLSDFQQVRFRQQKNSIIDFNWPDLDLKFIDNRDLNLKFFQSFSYKKKAKGVVINFYQK
jgi:hypothetical protein